MIDWFRTAAEWFSPPTTAWWFTALAAVLLTVLTAGLVLTYWPRRLAAPLTPLERRLAHGPRWLRLAPGLIAMLAAGLLAAAAAALCLGPRPPRTVVLQSDQVPADPTFWEGRIPPEQAGWPRLDAGPLVQAVLAQAQAEGADQWYSGSAAERQRLRELCLRAVLGGDPPRLSPARTSTTGDRLPRWVRESVELTILQGLLARENVPWVGVRSAEESPGWDRARRLLNPARTAWQLFPDAPIGPVRVRQLFDGWIQADGRIRFRALLEGQLQTATELTFTVVTGKAGTPVTQVRQSVLLISSCEIVEVRGAGPSPSPDARLAVLAEGGAVRTWLTPEGGPPVAAAVQGPRAGDLIRSIDSVGAMNDPAKRLQDLASPAFKLEARPSGASEPTVVLLPDAVIVLAPGLTATDIPATAEGTSPPSARPLDAPSYARRVSQLTYTAATAESWMSIGLRTTDTDPTPVTADWMRQLAGGVRMNQPLTDGRLLKANAALIDQPVLELGRVRGHTFVQFRMNLEQQGLVQGADGRLPATYEPARARAFVASLAWAIQRVLQEDAASPSIDDGLDSTVLLTADDLEACAEAGRRTADTAALTAIGIYLVALLLQVAVWRWPNVRLGTPSSHASRRAQALAGSPV